MKKVIDNRISGGKMILYQDTLVEITDTSIVLKQYYSPSLKSKNIPFSSIEKIEVLPPTILNGKWRIHGTGNFRTWFPLDKHRPKRDKIFLIYYSSKWIRSGFTVENSQTVQEILEGKGLIKLGIKK